MCHEQNDDNSNQEVVVPQEEGADEARGSSSSISEDEMLPLEALIRRIFKEGNQLVDEKEALKIDVDD